MLDQAFSAHTLEVLFNLENRKGHIDMGHKGQVSVPNSIVSCQGKAASNRAQEFIMS